MEGWTVTWTGRVTGTALFAMMLLALTAAVLGVEAVAHVTVPLGIGICVLALQAWRGLRVGGSRTGIGSVLVLGVAGIVSIFRPVPWYLVDGALLLAMQPVLTAWMVAYGQVDSEELGSAAMDLACALMVFLLVIY